jgi:hypothetical protein
MNGEEKGETAKARDYVMRTGFRKTTDKQNETLQQTEAQHCLNLIVV